MALMTLRVQVQNKGPAW